MLVNRALPTNNVSPVVLAFIGLNIFYSLYSIPFDMKYLFAFADRAGFEFVANRCTFLQLKTNLSNGCLVTPTSLWTYFTVGLVNLCVSKPFSTLLVC